MNPEPEGPRRSGSRELRAGYLGLVGFLVLEARVREGGHATSLHASAGDAGTTRAIARAFALGATLPLLAGRVPGPRLPQRAAQAGLLLEAGGLLVRAWSMRTLGAAYSRTLRTGETQALVTDGPYRLVRHPGYLGTLLTWAGFGLTSGNLTVAALLGALLGRTYARRMAAEERLLVRELPGYAEYARRSKRLVPFVW